MSNVDALDALRHTNPRHQPGFDQGVADIAGHTRETLAVAGGAGGSFGSALKTIAAGPNRQGRWLLSFLLAAGVVAITVLVVVPSITSVPRSNPPQAGIPAGPVGPGSASGSGTVGAATTTSSVPTPTTLAPPPGTVPSLPAAPQGSTNATNGRGATGATRGTGPAATASPPTVTRGPVATTSIAPPSSIVALAVPTCAVSALLAGPPQHQEVQVQDVGSGLASISNVAITNGTVSVPSFARGTTAMVLVVATKTDSTKDTKWSFDATDVAGHTTHCT